jgi:hypothetical protein
MGAPVRSCHPILPVRAVLGGAGGLVGYRGLFHGMLDAAASIDGTFGHD